ncbi:MAG: serine/threonine protein phosphatase [Ruminococcus sp.]|nr:serine/threonine protein phosphatase [Ruminococcus sp.]MCM1381202.1 serine/threonine protein phosphatase [Muribaculaceae bacterium]MCM1478728.1 serine/threonine protein phosphatase [Muribaculaceae bacterium]
MTYVLSDIHGNLERFEKILKQIDLQPEDTLYILGDVVDRHPFGITILKKIMKMPNVKMLLGNHEYMMMRALGFPYDENDTEETAYEMHEQWYRNGGGITNMEWNITPEETRNEIISYLKSLPLNYDIEVNGKRYKLIHAAPEDLYDLLGDPFIPKTYFCVWDRDAVMYAPQTDCTVIFGHTPTVNYQDCNPLQIWYGENLIGIDCACGHINPPDIPENQMICGRLACLRLDDMKEFYAE